MKYYAIVASFLFVAAIDAAAVKGGLVATSAKSSVVLQNNDHYLHLIYVSPAFKSIIKKMLLSHYEYCMLTKRPCTLIELFRLTITSPYGDCRLWTIPNYGAIGLKRVTGDTSALISLQEERLNIYPVAVYFSKKNDSNDFVDQQIKRAQDDMRKQIDQAPFDVAQEMFKSAARRAVTPKGRCEIL